MEPCSGTPPISLVQIVDYPLPAIFKLVVWSQKNHQDFSSILSRLVSWIPHLLLFTTDTLPQCRHLNRSSLYIWKNCNHKVLTHSCYIKMYCGAWSPNETQFHNPNRCSSCLKLWPLPTISKMHFKLQASRCCPGFSSPFFGPLSSVPRLPLFAVETNRLWRDSPPKKGHRSVNRPLHRTPHVVVDRDAFIQSDANHQAVNQHQQHQLLAQWLTQFYRRNTRVPTTTTNSCCVVVWWFLLILVVVVVRTCNKRWIQVSDSGVRWVLCEWWFRCGGEMGTSFNKGGWEFVVMVGRWLLGVSFWGFKEEFA